MCMDIHTYVNVKKLLIWDKPSDAHICSYNDDIYIWTY